VLFEDGYVQVLTPDAPLPATLTPVPTVTPSPTQQESTPPPTNTPRPTASATVAPTPTRESTPIPTSTPAPTAIPKVCELRSAYAINVRSAPSTTGQWIGSWAQGAYRTFDEFRYNPGAYMWGHSAQSPAGWSVIFDEATDTFWVYGTGTSETCRDVLGWPPLVAPPEPFARNLIGLHLIVGANNSFIQYAAKIGNAKGTTHTQPLLDLLKAANPNAVTIYRSLHNANGMIDCPLGWEWYSPEVYYAKLKPYLEGHNDLYEMMNECAVPLRADGSGDWAQWEKFTIAMLTMFTQDGRCALFGSFGPGAPDIPGWRNVVNIMRWSDDHPCQPGRYHGWATHTTLLMPDWVPINPGSYIRNPWIIHRDIMFRDWALANTGYNLAQFRGGVWVTEGGWTDYSVPFDRDFSCTEVAAGWKLTEADYKARRPWIRGVALWTLTRDGDPAWFNLQPCLGLLFQ
jgi:hypothetical protein